MLKSMTGFGSVILDTETFSLTVEVKSLNSKSLDIFTKISHIISHKEIELRNLIGKVLERGKVNLFINYQNKTQITDRATINKELVKVYYQELLETAKIVGATDTKDLFRIAMLMPDAYNNPQPQGISDHEWQTIQQAVENALHSCEAFRVQEGKMMVAMLEECITKITNALKKIELKDPERVVNLKNRLRQQVQEFVSNESLDQNRFEQELIYYIEKLDINEEKTRLHNHLQYFTESLHSQESNGKKLNFIAQEIGREINTIGSKANDAEIQRLVVQMKEELEKIKEQLNNVL